MKRIIFSSSDSLAATFSRIVLGIVLFPHGAQKLFGWFGGFGFTGTMNYFTDVMNLPWLISFGVIMLESIGALMLIFGFGTRILALLTGVLMIGIIFMSHLEFGFFMNWFGNQKGEGIEYFLLAIGLAVSLVFSGAGRFSVDRILEKKIQ